MYDFSTVKANLEARGFAAKVFATAAEAAAYLDGARAQKKEDEEAKVND